jgi:hypothetical protein
MERFPLQELVPGSELKAARRMQQSLKQIHARLLMAGSAEMNLTCLRKA